MAIAIGSDEAVRELEEAVRLARDPSHSVSDLWSDRVAQLEEWRSNKLALTAFATAALAKASEPHADPLALIDRSGDPHSYNARMLARDVLVPNARRLGILLGTPGPDPLAGSPWFGPERIDEIDKWKPSARQRADDLVGWLAALTRDDARTALTALVSRRTAAFQRQLDERKRALVASSPVIPLAQLGDALDRFIRRNPEEGRRGAALAAAAFCAAGHRVVARPVNDPGQVDVDVLDRKERLLIGIEVKQRPATEQDALDIAAGAVAKGATRAILCAFGQGALLLPRDSLIEEADARYGVILSIVDSASELIRLAAFTGHADRSSLLRELPRAFSKQLEALDCSQNGLKQWKAVTMHWARRP